MCTFDYRCKSVVILQTPSHIWHRDLPGSINPPFLCGPFLCVPMQEGRARDRRATPSRCGRGVVRDSFSRSLLCMYMQRHRGADAGVEGLCRGVVVCR